MIYNTKLNIAAMKGLLLVIGLFFIGGALNELIIVTGDTTIALVGLCIIYLGLLYIFCVPSSKKSELVSLWKTATS